MANTDPATVQELRRYANAVARKRAELASLRNQLDQVASTVDWDSKYAKRWKDKARRMTRTIEHRQRQLDSVVEALEQAIRSRA